jgi:uncharacterized membrane protein YcaP (DUF421 family)
MFDINWQELFSPTLPFLAVFLRGTIVYLTLFALLRFVPNRVAGTVSTADLLLVVLIANATQNALTSDYKSITDGLAVVATIVFWSYALNWLGHRFPQFQRLLRPQPLPLVKDGRLLRANMRRELLTEDELMTQVREQGVNDLAEVKEAFMEADGQISVIPRDGAGAGKKRKRLLA